MHDPTDHILNLAIDRHYADPEPEREPDEPEERVPDEGPIVFTLKLP